MNRLLVAFISSLFTMTSARADVSDRWSRTPLITVVMVDDRFQPDHLDFHANQPYRLRLENRGKDMHEFTAPAFLKAADVRNKNVLSNGGTDVVVQPGQSVTVFLAPRLKGHFSLTCADHDWDGMVGTIMVK